VKGREVVQLAHGGGGRLMQRLLDDLVLPALRNEHLEARHDGALLEVAGARLAFTTDAFVVKPLFFPGGDIGSLAVHGIVNDLAMCGARPRWLSCALILEEGFPLEDLRRILASLRAAADAAGVDVVTGDTKVVDRGRGDGLYIAAAGIGLRPPGPEILPARIQGGEAILLSGDVGRHGIAILSARERLSLDPPIRSDSAPLHGPVEALLEGGIGVRCLRDLTRGGLGAALSELAQASGCAMELDEPRVPVEPAVRGACELLGLDPIHVANEGRFIALVPEAEADRALGILREHPVSAGALQVGRVGAAGEARVTLRTALGTRRLLDLPSGEQLPRIC
jgi:hydrogenase expression/formation protein HypE